MVHKFRMFNSNIILDVETGCVFVVDELTYDMLDYLDFSNKEECLKKMFEVFSNHKKDEILERFEEIFSLYERKLIFSSYDYSNVENLVKNSVIKAICLHVAHDCNLRCRYCFASTGDFKQGRSLMSFETAKRAIDFLIEKSANRKNLEVDFFGGEPLLNFEVVKDVVKYARQKGKQFNKNFRFTITTNGLLLNSKNIEYLNENMSNVVLSLDGRENVNNKMRVNLKGEGSYQIIIKNIKEFVEKRKEKDYFVRGTFTKHNLDFFKDFVSLYENGFKNISIEPVVCSKDEDYAIFEEDLPFIFKEYEKIAEFIIKENEKGNNLNFFHFNIDLNQGPCVVKRLRGCGSGCEYVAVSPEGDIYPCHQFVGKSCWNMGNLFKNNFNEELKNNFSHMNLLNKKECEKCWAKYYCSGGCNANNYKFSKTLLEPYCLYCKMARKRVECAIAMKVYSSKIRIL